MKYPKFSKQVKEKKQLAKAPFFIGAPPKYLIYNFLLIY